MSSLIQFYPVTKKGLKLSLWNKWVAVFSCVWLFATLWTVAHQVPLSMGLSRQEHWSGLPFSFSNSSKWKVKVKSLSGVQLFATPWIAAYQAPPSTGGFQERVLEWVAIAFSAQRYYLHPNHFVKICFWENPKLKQFHPFTHSFISIFWAFVLC